MGSMHQICLRWNNHLSNFPKVFEELRKSKDLVDVTLCCEGRKIKAHKLVLSACSQYFQGLFSEIPCKHPVIFFRDVTFPELESIVNYMYKGEVSVPRDNLDTFLKTAEALQVKGLVMEENGDSNIPAVKESVAQKSTARSSEHISTNAPGSSVHLQKEKSWSQTFIPQSKASAPVHKETVSTSQTTFTPSSIHQPQSSQTTFSPVSIHQPSTPQSLGASSSLHSQPDDEDDDDIIIEPDIKCEAMDQSMNDNAISSVTDSAKHGSQSGMDSELYMGGDEPSESFSHGDRLSDEIDSIMSNIGSQGGGGMEMGMGPSTSSDGQGEGSMTDHMTDNRSRKPRRSLDVQERMEIILLSEAGVSQRTVASRFGVSQMTVCNILKRKAMVENELRQFKRDCSSPE